MRLDVTSESGWGWAVNHGYIISFTDPGLNDVIDFCMHCANNEGVEDAANVEHPPYEDSDYTCVVCGIDLDDTND